MGKLAGKIALVTGASKGIGSGIALAFAREGADLLLSARGEESLANTAKEVAALGVRVEVQAGDVVDSRTGHRERMDAESQRQLREDARKSLERMITLTEAAKN